MHDADKTPEQLIQELVALRQRCAALEVELESRVAKHTAELQRAQERFVKAFQASPDAIAITSMDGRYIDVNPSFQRLSGYSRDSNSRKASNPSNDADIAVGFS